MPRYSMSRHTALLAWLERSAARWTIRLPNNRPYHLHSNALYTCRVSR